MTVGILEGEAEDEDALSHFLNSYPFFYRHTALVLGLEV